MRIQDDEGVWHEGQDQILNAVLAHFSGVYRSDQVEGVEECMGVVPKLVTNEINSKLLALVSMEEVNAAVFSMGSMKASGPDDLNGLFYQKKLGSY